MDDTTHDEREIRMEILLFRREMRSAAHASVPYLLPHRRVWDKAFFPGLKNEKIIACGSI
jgi:hypothetical protein